MATRERIIELRRQARLLLKHETNEEARKRIEDAITNLDHAARAKTEQEGYGCWESAVRTLRGISAEVTEAKH